MSDIKLAKSSYSYLNDNSSNPWSPSDVDKFEFDKDLSFEKIIDACRFFYKRDPIGATVINKLVEIGINDLVIAKNGLSDNEARIFYFLEPKLKEYAKAMALEYLVTGLVVPEIKFAAIDKSKYKAYGIKKYNSLILPESMWIRDPKTIKIKKTLLSDKPSYFVKIPQEVINFIKNEGAYTSKLKDPKLYAELLAYYPLFVQEIKDGKTEILLTENTDLILRRNVLSNTAEPLQYFYPALESMRHKRNLRRMDYAIASRVISAIQLIKLGSDEFPLTEDDSEQLESIKNQMLWRDNGDKNVERIFQLFTPHTTQIEWIFPPTEALLNEIKYKDVNQDILFALGFPRILLTGESERTGTSDPQYATMSPVQTMNNFRDQILEVLRYIANEVADRNNLKSFPIVTFKPLQLSEFEIFAKALSDLYTTGNLSRQSYAEAFGYNWNDEIVKKIEEKKVMVASDLEEFAPQPFSPQPNTNKTPDTNKPPVKEDTKDKVEENPTN